MGLGGLMWNRKNHPKSALRANFSASGGQRGQSLPVPGHSWNYRLGTTVTLNHTGKSFCQGSGPAEGEIMKGSLVPSPGPGMLAQQWEIARKGKGHSSLLLSPPTGRRVSQEQQAESAAQGEVIVCSHRTGSVSKSAHIHTCL